MEGSTLSQLWNSAEETLENNKDYCYILCQIETSSVLKSKGVFHNL